MNFLYPNLYVKNVKEIPFSDLYAKGYRGIMFDVDNTLVPFDLMDAPEELIAFINSLRDMGFKVGLVSNNTTKRVQALNEKLGLHIMPNAMKPFTFKLKRMMKILGIGRKEAIFVGDQLFTDVWVGNRMRIFTVLVEPIQRKEQMITRVKRGAEAKILKGYIKRYKS